MQWDSIPSVRFDELLRNASRLFRVTVADEALSRL